MSRFFDGDWLLFDGAMGTLYASLYPKEAQSCEQALLQYPQRIADIHKRYIAAGAKAIKTCTYGLSQMQEQDPGLDPGLYIQQAAACAKEACEGKDVQIFADLGPASASDPLAFWKTQAELFLQTGIRHFLLETLPDLQGVQAFAKWLKAQDKESILLVSLASRPDSFTSKGLKVQDLLVQLDAMEEVDAMGLNCMSGPYHLLEIIRSLPACHKPLLCMPNAGYPTIVQRSAQYDSSPDYFAAILQEIYQNGASILGGCCGTTPAHIEKTAQFLQNARSAASILPEPAQQAAQGSRRPSSRIWNRIGQHEKIIAVELDPPANDQIAPFLSGASRLVQAGAHMITLADCPIGRPRADACLLACKIKRELGVDVLPHMTCRDRNLNAARALLLGLSMENIHNILLVTGDPIPMADRSEVKSVFSCNSRTLAQYVQKLYPQHISHPFQIFGALDLNAVNFEAQLKIALEKEASGMVGFLTQPVLSKRALENLKTARARLSGLILGGIYPVVSYKNACFLNNEISGMYIDAQIIEAYKGKNREESEAIAIDISLDLAKQMEDYVDGYYLMTPFFRIALMETLIKHLSIKDTGK